LCDLRIHSENLDGDFDEADVDICERRFGRGGLHESLSIRPREQQERAGSGSNEGRHFCYPVTHRPMDVDGIEIDETTMHEVMRILIRVCRRFFNFKIHSQE